MQWCSIIQPCDVKKLLITTPPTMILVHQESGADCESWGDVCNVQESARERIIGVVLVVIVFREIENFYTTCHTDKIQKKWKLENFFHLCFNDNTLVTGLNWSSFLEWMIWSPILCDKITIKSSLFCEKDTIINILWMDTLPFVSLSMGGGKWYFSFSYRESDIIWKIENIHTNRWSPKYILTTPTT